MLGEHFRPWGQLHWVLSKIPKQTWSVLGCVATEDRCVAVWQYMRAAEKIGRSVFLEISAEPSRFTELSTKLKNAQREKIEAAGTPTEGMRKHELLDKHEKIVSAADDFLKVASSSVILDISCFPKRFFFPFVKRLLSSTTISNLLVTYTVPETYFEGILAENHQPLNYLPLFGIETYPERKADLAIIGIGFVPLGITQLIDPERKAIEFQFLFPFPPGPPHFHRNWKFVAQLESKLSPDADPVRMEGHNVSDTFDHIIGLTNGGIRTAVFAPYGPKPMSLAMCLYAILTGSSVYYTQPQTYHPRYSTGVTTVNQQPLAYTYCLRLDGRDFYALPVAS